MFSIEKNVRRNILDLKPYSSAREEYKGEADIWLDANENPFNTAINRYPDPFQIGLKDELVKLKGVNQNQIFIGNGSDEAIDLLFRAFCEPQIDKAYLFQPTYGMYEVLAMINNVNIERIRLNEDFSLPKYSEIRSRIDSKGLLFICSPNNPTGTIQNLETIKSYANNFSGIVVVDEAYIDFSDSESAISLINDYPNVVVLQTLSKAYGAAGLRLGMAYANDQIIEILNKIKPPYNVNALSQMAGLEILKNQEKTTLQINSILQERAILIQLLNGLSVVKKTYPSSSNFILVEFQDADKIFTVLRSKGIIIRNRASQVENCLRITIGTSVENERLINAIKEIIE